MTEESARYATRGIEPADMSHGFTCGKHPLDDYFRRHALANDAAGIGRAYVLARTSNDESSLPPILGFYTLSMAVVSSGEVAPHLTGRLPKYPLPVALIGRLAVDERAQGRRIGEQLLIDAMQRVVDAAEIVGCVGIIVDAKDESAEGFYGKYDFVSLETDGWPRRMFVALGTVREALE
jgi:GNAT superfamily N-acetyltransferase